MKTENKKIAFLGDSITYGVGASSKETSYVSLVTKEGEFEKGYNFGVSGSRIAKQIKEIFDSPIEDFVTRAERMPEDADIVLVFGGTNDYAHGDAPLGRLGDNTNDTFYGAMDVLINKLIAKYPTSKIAILTPLHCENEERYFNNAGIRNCGTLKDYVNAEKEVAAKYSVPVIDLYESSGICPDNKINKETYTIDGLHPNDNGYRLIADKVLNFIKYTL